MKLEELKVYQMAMDIGERVWEQVNEWDIFAKDTVGKQFVKAADSIASNISEGYGRYHYKENRQFCYYGRGSAFETTTWVKKSQNRKLISDTESEELKKDISDFTRKLNRYISSIGTKNQ